MAKMLTGDFEKTAKKRSSGSRPRTGTGYRLKLAVAFSDPLIWRSIQVPGRMTLGTLHRVIQVCMGWDNSDTPPVSGR